MDDIYFMKKALMQARRAEAAGEVPIGAVIVKDGKIISRAKNEREGKKNALLHAEITAISRACKALGGWRLCGCTLYVTLEPCVMCAGAIMNARLDRVVFGATDPKAGAYGSVMNINELSVNHKPLVTAGVMQSECADILRRFFSRLRQG